MTKSDIYIHETAIVDEGAVIGRGTKVWHFSHVMAGARIGENCVIGQNVFVGNVRIGSGCKIQNNVSVYDGVTLEDGVFVGPSAVFTNVRTPRAEVDRHGEYTGTIVQKGATIGANATIVCGIELGKYCLVGAGAVVTRPVPPQRLVVGAPARPTGWVCRCGEILDFVDSGSAVCKRCKQAYRLEGQTIVAAADGSNEEP